MIIILRKYDYWKFSQNNYLLHLLQKSNCKIWVVENSLTNNFDARWHKILFREPCLFSFVHSLAEGKCNNEIILIFRIKFLALFGNIWAWNTILYNMTKSHFNFMYNENCHFRLERHHSTWASHQHYIIPWLSGRQRLCWPLVFQHLYLKEVRT